jgi:hypothetical protein
MNARLSLLHTATRTRFSSLRGDATFDGLYAHGGVLRPHKVRA